MRKQGATFQLGEKHITRKYGLHFLFFLHHLQLFIKLWPKHAKQLNKAEEEEGMSGSPSPILAGHWFVNDSWEKNNHPAGSLTCN